MEQVIPVAEYGVEAARRPVRTAARIALLALGGWLVLAVVLFGLRSVRLSASSPVPATPVGAAPSPTPAPAAPATLPAGLPPD